MRSACRIAILVLSACVLIRIENNMIRRVEMIGTGVPYHFNSSWGAGLSGK